MQVEAAVIREQGITFAVVVVKNHLLDNRSEAEDAQIGFASLFPGMPIVLMGQDSSSVPRYFGRNDIILFLASINPSRFPWKQYTFTF